MRKEPEERCGSAGELGDDLDRFALGQPVVAREPSLGYLLRRLAGRNRAAVLIAAASLLAICRCAGRGRLAATPGGAAADTRLAADARVKAAFTRAIVVADREESIRHWRRGLEIGEAALAEKPDDLNRMRNVALIETYLGGRFDALGRRTGCGSALSPRAGAR
jgi:hypothetical protein